MNTSIFYRILGICLLLLPMLASAQVSINQTHADPDSSAMLDVQSTDKGMLLPRMTSEQRDAIANPAPGLMIYNVEDSCFNYFSGMEWIKDCGRKLTADIGSSAPLTGRGPWEERGYAIDTDPEGNLYLTGNSNGQTSFGTDTLNQFGGQDIFVAKFNPQGEVIWAVNAGSSNGVEFGRDISVDDAGNSYVTGGFGGTATFGNLSLTSSGNGNGFVVKYDSAGQAVWVTKLGSSDYSSGFSIAHDGIGNCYVSGSFYGTATFGTFTLNSVGSRDLFVAKLDASGQVVWVKSTGSGGRYHYGYSLNIDANGDIYTAGSFGGSATFDSYSLTTNGKFNVFVAKFNPAGQVLWARQEGNTRRSVAYGVDTDAAGNVYVGGLFSTDITFGTTTLTADSLDAFLVKYNSSGQVQWATNMGGSLTEEVNSVAVDDAGNSFITGKFTGSFQVGTYSFPANGEHDIFAAKYDPAGQLLWAKAIGGAGADWGNGISVAPSGNCYVVGFYTDNITIDGKQLSSEGSKDILIWPLGGSDGESFPIGPVNNLAASQDGDTDASNELQSLSLSGTQLSIENGNAVDLSSIDTDDQTLSLSGTQLSIADGNSVDISSIDTDTDDQTLSLSGTQLSIADGNSVDISSIDTDTDDQTLSLSGTQLSIADGNSVDLASIDTDTDTDDQTLSLSGTQLSIADGNSVDLASIDTDTDTDDQTLSLSGTQLSIADGNSVDLASIDTDTDDQTLSFSGTQLSIIDGNTVDLVSLKDNLGNHVATQNLELGPYTLSGDGDSEGVMVTASGNVGINISNPATPLGIAGNGGTNYVGITQNQVMGGATMELTTPDASGNQATRIGLSGGANDADIVFFNGARGSEGARMIIDGSNGYVGIGTNTPDSRLDLAGGNISLNGGFLSNDGDNEGVFVAADGNVGIGTTSPQGALDITRAGDGETLLRLTTERAWAFQQEANGSGAALRLRNLIGGNKRFSIDTDGQTQFRSQNGSSAKVTIDHNSGNLGIGTTSPTSRLDVAGGNISLNGGYLSNDGGNEGIRIGDNGRVGIGGLPLNANKFLVSGDANWGTVARIETSSDLTVGLAVSGITSISNNNVAIFKVRTNSKSNMLSVFGDGRVGIGTGNPSQAKVVINGSENHTLSYGYLNGSGNTGTASGTNTYSLYASHRIAASEFNAHSDVRIKRIMGQSNGVEDLNKLMDIEITDYAMIDTLSKGTKPYKKVIAQQVAEVYPQAVTTDLTEVVPDIYQRAEMQDGWIMLATDLKPGERVKLITEQSSEVYEVTEAEPNRFKVSLLSSDLSAPSFLSGQVFVYGREVEDFHTVDYEALSMLNISATQAQQRIIEEQQAEIKALTTRLLQSEANNQQLQSAVEARLQAVEALLQQGASDAVSQHQN